MVTIIPESESLLATTELVDSIQPSAPPNDNVKICCPSLEPLRSASTITEKVAQEK
jgi:hypothetical protein